MDGELANIVLQAFLLSEIRLRNIFDTRSGVSKDRQRCWLTCSLQSPANQRPRGSRHCCKELQ